VNQFHSQIIPSRVCCFASKLSSLNETPREKQEGKGINKNISYGNMFFYVKPEL
jgi:hypothetical protein